MGVEPDDDEYASDDEPMAVVAWMNLGMAKITGKKISQELPSLKLTAGTWKWMVGRLVSFLGRPVLRCYVSFREGIQWDFSGDFPNKKGETNPGKDPDPLPSTTIFKGELGPGDKGFGHTKRLPETPSQTPSTSIGPIGIVSYTSKIFQGPLARICLWGSNSYYKYVLTRYIWMFSRGWKSFPQKKDMNQSLIPKKKSRPRTIRTSECFLLPWMDQLHLWLDDAWHLIDHEEKKSSIPYRVVAPYYSCK